MNESCLYFWMYEKYKTKITVMEFQSCKSAHSVCENFLTKPKIEARSMCVNKCVISLLYVFIFLV